MKQSEQSLAIIGSGPSCIYLLKQLLENLDAGRGLFSGVVVFEKQKRLGMGMPYSPETTDRYNMSNISSEELPELMRAFADWLRDQDASRLGEWGIEPGQVREDEVYPRLALGAYFEAQFAELAEALESRGLPVYTHAPCKIVDVRDEKDGITLLEDSGREFRFGRVVIASGHCWPEDDEPERGYYASPWPIRKLLPVQEELFNFTIGTLGASLSAFDVLASLAQRHGTFSGEGRDLAYHLHPEAEGFRVVMHSEDGLLPHLQFGQEEPLRKIHRHVSEKELLALRDASGFLRLDTYFDRVCRPVLIDAFEKNGKCDLAEFLRAPKVGFVEFAERMTETHDYTDAFEGMRHELKEAEASHEQNQPIHWKEKLDDLMYTLNYHAHLLPAEDHLTLQGQVLPFVMNVIAALPLSSAYALLALHNAGCLHLKPGRAKMEDAAPGEKTTKVTVTDPDDENRKDECEYRLFINCAGQKPLEMDEFPFASLRDAGRIRAARAPFQEPKAQKDVPEHKQEKLFREDDRWFYENGGIDVSTGYAVIGQDGRTSRRIYDIAFPHIAGERPYSYGLQACNDTARLLVEGWLTDKKGTE
jgi:hypothetical protein